MQIPNLPTDNLYKFMALSGVIIVIAFNYFIITDVYKRSNEIDNINLEISLLAHDTTTAIMMYNSALEKRYVVEKYITEKFPDQIPLINKMDTFYIFNILYYLALRNAELMPIYEKIESVYMEDIKHVSEFEREKIKLKSLNDTARSKNNLYWLLIIVLGIFDLIGIWLAQKGFWLWYIRVQIYQDEALKESALKPPK